MFGYNDRITMPIPQFDKIIGENEALKKKVQEKEREIQGLNELLTRGKKE